MKKKQARGYFRNSVLEPWIPKIPFVYNMHIYIRIICLLARYQPQFRLDFQQDWDKHFFSEVYWDSSKIYVNQRIKFNPVFTVFLQTLICVIKNFRNGCFRRFN